MTEEEEYAAYATVAVAQHPCAECGELFVVHAPGKFDHPWSPGAMDDSYFPPEDPMREDVRGGAYPSPPPDVPIEPIVYTPDNATTETGVT